MSNNKNSMRTYLIYIAAFCMAFIMIIPLLWMIISAFKAPGSTVTVITELMRPPYTLDSFKEVLEPDGTAMMWRWTFNSVVVGVVQTVVTVLFSSWAAYAVSRIDFKGKTIIFALMLAGLMVPMESIVVPLFEMIVELNWTNTYHALIWP